MSAARKYQDGYRCDACRMRRNRCEECREARAAKQREQRARKREQGICVQCTEPATEGTLCPAHQAMNRELSKASHAIARAENRE